MNAVEIEEAISELARLPFDSEEFAYSFLEAFGNKSTTIKRLRKGDSNKSKIKGGVLQRNDIFGSMIQAVADDVERRHLGMHYTSVPNILKVLNPLFLDDLRTHLEEAGDSARKLLNLRKRILHIRVFDPACGSGNFLGDHTFIFANVNH